MEPILVKNPKTGQYVNVAPLFETVDLFDVPLSKSIASALRVINLANHDEGSRTNVVNVNYDLYRMQDMFEAMFSVK